MGMLLLNDSSEFGVRRELFSNNEQGLWLDPSDMNAGKAGWRRNLLLQSEVFDSSNWTKTSVSVTANATNAPDGTTTADTLSGTGFVYQNLISGVQAGQTVTASVYVKIASSVGQTRMRIMNSAIVSNIANIALVWTNGVPVATVTVGAGAVESIGGGWYRLILTGILTDNSASVLIYPDQNGNNRDIYIWGAQLELGSTPTEYQRITDFSTEFKAAFPTHTLYQDSNGVTPCTAAGDPVGLILDQSRGGLGALGSELKSTGLVQLTGSATAATYNTTTGEGTAARVDAVNQSFVLVATTSGKWYLIDLQNTSANTVLVRADSGGGSTLYTLSGNTRTSFILAGQTIGFAIACNTVNPTTASFTVHSIREVPGNHAFQTTSASRPTLARIPSSGRRNLLTRTEELDNAAWAKSVAAVTANTHVACDGTQTADTLEDNSAGGYGVVSQSFTYSAVAYTFSIDIRKTSGTPASFPGIQCGPAAVFHIIHTTNGTVSSTAGGQTCTVTSIDSNWWRVVVNFTPTAGADRVAIFPAISSDSTTLSTAAVGTVIVSRAQLELGSTATNYQKVVATTDVTESGVGDLWHLVFDGSDDSLVTNSISFDTWTQETRRNLLVDTESFGASTWTRLNITAADNTTETTDPLGTNTSSKLTASSSTVRCAQNFTGRTAGENWVFSFYVKAGTATLVQYIISNGLAETSNSIGEFTFSNQTFSGALGTYVTSRTATDVGNGWYRIVLICTIPAGQTAIRFNPAMPIVNTETAYYWGAQAELATSATTYQRVGTDEMTVIAGVRKLSDAAIGIVAEHGNTVDTLLAAPRNVSPDYGADLRHSGVSSTTGIQTYTAPISNVVSVLFDRSAATIGGQVQVRANGTLPAQNNTGTGPIASSNFTSNVLYIGRRNNATLPFNGHLYQLIIRGKTTPTGKLLEAERFVARRTGVTGI